MSGNHITAKHADDAKSQYSNCLQSVLNKNLVSFQENNIDEKRLDDFLISYFDNSSHFAQLIGTVKFMMILSPEQLAAEKKKKSVRKHYFRIKKEQ